MARLRKPKIPAGVTIDWDGVVHFPPFIPPRPDDLSAQGLKEWTIDADRVIRQQMDEYEAFLLDYDAWLRARYPKLAAKRAKKRRG